MKHPRPAAAARPSSRGAMDFSTNSASFTKLMQLAGDDKQEDTAQDEGVEEEEEEEVNDDDEEDAGEVEDDAAEEDESRQASDNKAEVSVGEEEASDSVSAAHSDSVDSTRRKPASSSSSSSSTTPAAPLSSSSLASFSAEMAATGLIYFSRLPPHMKPHKLRQLLSQYGTILRVYLTPEHTSLTHRRRTTTAASSSAVKRYTDGWVEFADKRVAKAVAVTLNGTTMGGRKRGYWYDDVWSCKYLKGFKWQHLTERGVMEGKGREGRRREEVGRAKREAEHYRQQMDKRKKVEAIRTRKEKQRQQEGGAGGAKDEERPVLRTFYQRPAFPGKPLEE